MTSSIIDFIEACLDKDERDALAAGGKEWRQYDPRHEHGRIEEVGGDVVTYDEGSPTEGQAAHIARHDPARVLREVEAKRAIIAEHSIFVAENEDPRKPRHEVGCERCGYLGNDPTSGCKTLRSLAATYSDHPDYRKEWAA